MFLAGDVGGSSTRLALVDPQSKVMVKKQVFFNENHKSLLAVTASFLEKEKVSAVCFALAGPVSNGKSRLTNIAWSINRQALIKSFGTKRIYLINDLHANALGVLSLRTKDFFVLHKGQQMKEANCALLSAGTGLGEACLFYNRGQYYPFACEGGHVDFAPRNKKEWEFFLFLKRKFGHVSYERVLSGNGLTALYYFLAKKHLDAAAISGNALRGFDKYSKEALQMFISLYGSAAGNLALKFLARGGVYIGGGIAPKIIDAFQSDVFYESFVNKGRMRPLLEKIPIKIIRNEECALLGAIKFLTKAPL